MGAVRTRQSQIEIVCHQIRLWERREQGRSQIEIVHHEIRSHTACGSGEDEAGSQYDVVRMFEGIVTILYFTIKAGGMGVQSRYLDWWLWLYLERRGKWGGALFKYPTASCFTSVWHPVIGTKHLLN